MDSGPDISPPLSYAQIASKFIPRKPLDAPKGFEWSSFGKHTLLWHLQDQDSSDIDKINSLIPEFVVNFFFIKSKLNEAQKADLPKLSLPNITSFLDAQNASKPQIFKQIFGLTDSFLANSSVSPFGDCLQVWIGSPTFPKHTAVLINDDTIATWSIQSTTGFRLIHTEVSRHLIQEQETIKKLLTRDLNCNGFIGCRFNPNSQCQVNGFWMWKTRDQGTFHASMSTPGGTKIKFTNSSLDDLTLYPLQVSLPKKKKPFVSRRVVQKSGSSFSKLDVSRQNPSSSKKRKRSELDNQTAKKSNPETPSSSNVVILDEMEVDGKLAKPATQATMKKKTISSTTSVESQPQTIARKHVSVVNSTLASSSKAGELTRAFKRREAPSSKTPPINIVEEEPNSPRDGSFDVDGPSTQEMEVDGFGPKE